MGDGLKRARAAARAAGRDIWAVSVDGRAQVEFRSKAVAYEHVAAFPGHPAVVSYWLEGAWVVYELIGAAAS